MKVSRGYYFLMSGDQNLIRMRQRFTARNQTAFARALKSLSSSSSPGALGFNIPSLLRLHDLNPLIYVAALLLFDAGVEEDPKTIRDHPVFATLIDRLEIQKSTGGSKSREKQGDVKNSHEASLVLLEVFTYMVIIHRARSREEERRGAITSGNLYEQEELTV